MNWKDWQEKNSKNLNCTSIFNKSFEQEILNSDQDRITEELKKYKLDYSKLEELNIGIL